MRDYIAFGLVGLATLLVCTLLCGFYENFLGVAVVNPLQWHVCRIDNMTAIKGNGTIQIGYSLPGHKSGHVSGKARNGCVLIKSDLSPFYTPEELNTVCAEAEIRDYHIEKYTVFTDKDNRPECSRAYTTAFYFYTASALFANMITGNTPLSWRFERIRWGAPDCQ